ncbi:hypothetical protein F2Q68_00025462 [Brassica cretica]|uniref:Uncharacterized protein n=1 Tax=Brassica cretica TaxID=69181 RepID=A0A8S9IAY9_BRACR|nr:hypothetical protein F2Q68_00025462 [Brassica cretica]
MNKHLVENFLAFRNSQGRLRDAKKDQEDSLGDEVLATDQGERGRMFSRRFGLASSPFCLLICPSVFVSVCPLRMMNKHLVENFLAFRNSQGRLRDAKKDQEDSLGDEVLATDQGERGRMVLSDSMEINFVSLKVIWKQYSRGGFVTDWLCFPFRTINLGFFRKIFGRSTAASCIPDLLCFLFFSGTNLGFLRKIFGGSRARNRELVSLHFLWRKVVARFSIFSRAVAFAYCFDQAFCGYELE